jgi:CDP-glucose 4,6-dehydratase
MTAGNPPASMMVERIIDCDLRNRDDVINAVAVADPDIVFHLGALTQVTEAKVQFHNAMMTNAVGTLNVLEACHAVRPGGIKIVVSTTDKVYGSWPNLEPFKESDRLSPSHPYDVSKACADIIAQGFGVHYEENVFIARLANVYGPGDTNFKRLIPGLVRWGIEQEKPVLRSDGKQLRQYIFISDALAALIEGAIFLHREYPDVGVFNFASDEKPLSVMQVYDAVKKALGSEGIILDEPEILHRAYDETSELVIEPTWAKSVLGWRPKIGFEKGLRSTIDWMKYYLRKLNEERRQGR